MVIDMRAMDPGDNWAQWRGAGMWSQLVKAVNDGQLDWY